MISLRSVFGWDYEKPVDNTNLCMYVYVVMFVCRRKEPPKRDAASCFCQGLELG